MLDSLRQLFALASDYLLSAGRSLRANWGLAFFSLILAFGLWLAVTEAENPSRTDFFPVSIPVEPANLQSGLALASPIEAVTIRITAPENLWSRLSVDDFRAIADLSRATVGENRVPVQAQAVRGGDITVEAVVPDRVLVRVGPSVSRPVPVVVNLIGSPALGYEVGTPLVNPQQVTVSGAEEIVSQVEVAAADVNIFGSTDKIRRSLSLTARDGRGLVVNVIDLDPAEAQVEVPIERRVLTSAYPVRATLVGEPALGYNIASIVVDPTSVTAIGPQEVLESITFLATAGVDVTGATSDVIQRVPLALPPNVNVIGATTILVWARIEAAHGEAVFGVAPRFQGADSSLNVRPITSLVEVRVAGPLPQLRTLTPDQITVIADLTGLSTGEHRLAPQVQVPQSLSVISVSPANVEVELLPPAS